MPTKTITPDGIPVHGEPEYCFLRVGTRNAGVAASRQSATCENDAIDATPLYRDTAARRNGHGQRTVILLGAIAGLMSLSTWLSLHRIYQVDECQNIYMAAVLAKGLASQFFTNAALFLLGPLSWITTHYPSSEQIFTSARLLFALVFWINTLLLAAIASGRLFSSRGALALFMAATLAPLWDYGFEIRHDNLVLSGLLLSWWTVRTRPFGLVSYCVAGATAVALLFIAVKSVVYVVPLSLAILAFPPPAHKRSRLHLALAWVGGAVLATTIIRLCYGSTGNWDIYLRVFRGVSKYSATSSSSRFWPWFTLERLLGQTPLLLAFTTAAAGTLIGHLWTRGRQALSWDGLLPEGLLLAAAFMGLGANPSPYPYNLLLVVPFMFLFAFAHSRDLWKLLERRRTLLPLAGTLVLFGHLAPFGIETARHLEHTNLRQDQVMHFAEALTDPRKDSVYDGIGMVPSRRTIHYQWYLHSLNMGSFLEGPGEKLRDMLAANPPAVFIPSYRTDWLPDADHAFVRSNYISLSDDFWVLGKVLPVKGGSFSIIHPGRYYIGPLHGTNIAEICKNELQTSVPAVAGPTLTGSLDGAPISSGPVLLMSGPHKIESASESGIAVVWIGPTLKSLPPLAAGDHRLLFVNWY